MWKECGRAGQSTDDSMTHACWITKATNEHSKYVRIIVFPREKWFRERGSTLCLYIHRLSCFIFSVINMKALSFTGKKGIRSVLAIDDQILGKALNLQNKICV